MKCCNSAFTAQGLRVIIVVIQVGSEGAEGKQKRG
jgi:hypothetical protein